MTPFPLICPISLSAIGTLAAYSAAKGLNVPSRPPNHTLLTLKTAISGNRQPHSRSIRLAPWKWGKFNSARSRNILASGTLGSRLSTRTLNRIIDKTVTIRLGERRERVYLPVETVTVAHDYLSFTDPIDCDVALPVRYRRSESLSTSTWQFDTTMCWK